MRECQVNRIRSQTIAELSIFDPRSLGRILASSKATANVEWASLIERCYAIEILDGGYLFGNDNTSIDYREHSEFLRKVFYPSKLVRIQHIRTIRTRAMVIHSSDRANAVAYLKYAGDYLKKFAAGFQRLRKGADDWLDGFDEGTFLRLCDSDPEFMLAYLKLPFLNRDSSRRIALGAQLAPERVMQSMESNLGEALARLELFQELGVEQVVKQYVLKNGAMEEKFSATFRPSNLFVECRINPKRIVAAIEVLSECGGEAAFQLNFRTEEAEHLITINSFYQAIEQEPEGAIAYLKVAHRLGGPEIYKKHFADPFLSSWPLRPTSSLYRWEQIWVLIEAIRLLGPGKTCNQYVRRVVSRPKAEIQELFAQLPLTALPSLKWLAENCDSHTLKEMVAEITGESH